MKDEIKEINIPENVLVALGDLTNGALNYYKATETVKVRHNTILDYITNLQERFDALLEAHKIADELETEYQERNEKAIEYIKEHYYEMIFGGDFVVKSDELLSILNGGDE